MCVCVCGCVCVCVFYCKHVDQIKGHLFFHCTGNNFKLNENDSRKKKMAQDFYFSALSKFKTLLTNIHTHTDHRNWVHMYVSAYVCGCGAQRAGSVCVCVCLGSFKSEKRPHTDSHTYAHTGSAQWKCRCWYASSCFLLFCHLMVFSSLDVNVSVEIRPGHVVDVLWWVTDEKQ